MYKLRFMNAGNWVTNAIIFKKNEMNKNKILSRYKLKFKIVDNSP